MNKIQKGLAESATGIVMGFVLMAMISSFAEDGLIPGYFVFLFGLVCVIANLATLNSVRYLGLLYTIGWLFGAILFFDLLSPIGIAFNIAGPAVIIILRLYLWIKNTMNNYQ
jgi:hypothetical protein